MLGKFTWYSFILYLVTDIIGSTVAKVENKFTILIFFHISATKLVRFSLVLQCAAVSYDSKLYYLEILLF